MSKDKNGYAKGMYNKRLREYAKQAIKDLTLLAENLPEDQQTQIFNSDAMRPLFKSLFSLLQNNIVSQTQTNQASNPKTRAELEERRERLLKLCFEAINEIGLTMNAHSLAPYEMSILLSAGQNETLPALTGVKAVYLKGFSQRQR